MPDNPDALVERLREASAFLRKTHGSWTWAYALQLAEACDHAAERLSAQQQQGGAVAGLAEWSARMSEREPESEIGAGVLGLNDPLAAAPVPVPEDQP
jgi:hypothetical protein